jgi:hypothetical protein
VTVPTCSFADASGPCRAPAVWVVLVGEEGAHPACDRHRNDVLLAFDAKDVSGLEPIAAETD